MRDDRRCTARSKRTQRRCGRAAIRGGRVCPMHGGTAPQVQRAASDRIAASVDPAIDRLHRAMKSNDHGAAVRAARDILDRAGVGRDDDRVSRADVSRLLRGVVAVVLGNVSDPAEHRAIAYELRKLAVRFGDSDVAASMPTPPPRPALPAVAVPDAARAPEPEPRPKEVVL